MVKAIARGPFALGSAITAASWLLGACSGGHAGSPLPPPDPGSTVTPTLSASEQAERAQVAAALAAVDGIDATGLRARFPAGFSGALGYDPLAATNFSLIQASPLALNDGERAVLAKNGFVISDRQRFPGFAYGYDSIYAHDLPLFVSAGCAVVRSRPAGTRTCSTAATPPTSTRRSPTCTPRPPTRPARPSAMSCTSAPATRA